MQQKIIIARWLLLEPKVLILDEPTKGVDIGTRASIYAILRDIAAKGTAILIVSSEFEELLGLADRVIVISDGVSIADMPSAYLDEEKLTLHGRAAHLDGAQSAPFAGARRPVRRRGVLGDPRRGAGLLPQRRDRECERRSVAARGRRAAIRGDADRDRAEARAPDFVLDPASGLKSLVVDVRSHRGHELGSIGVVIRPGRLAAARRGDALGDPGTLPGDAMNGDAERR